MTSLQLKQCAMRSLTCSEAQWPSERNCYNRAYIYL